jgi:hypothetical protein
MAMFEKLIRSAQSDWALRSRSRSGCETDRKQNVIQTICLRVVLSTALLGA